MMNIPMPPRRYTQDEDERRVGMELEFAGVEPDTITSLIKRHYGGEINRRNEYEYEVKDTRLGNFVVELDAALLKEFGRQAEESSEDQSDLEKWSKDVLSATAELLVPWEIVTDPIGMSSLHELHVLSEDLRESGARGTRDAVRYAFGLHINPELPDLSAQTILAYLRAYLCLYDWLKDREQVDLIRKLTPYIDHFEDEYIVQVVNLEYQPDLNTLIEDYLEKNPTRNRSMDLLPLFAHLDEKRVKSTIDDPRIKPRPTFHYRLPNCDIDRSDWSVLTPWKDWLQVEFLAADNDRLREACEGLSKDYQRLTRAIDDQWRKESEKWLTDLSSV
jgi:hypothetical protein